ncbi:hypothetical protein LCGC14_1172970 [marine sediment metagenome]|uniref:Uncharacterized protein n=1 Tax=marine sediment metagenome TaxID=412755 RepID=A0A0F9MC77_9ZZZZ
MTNAYQLDRESITLSAPTTITCKFIVDPELVLRWQRFGGRPHKGTPIGLMRESYPFDVLKRKAVQEARIFVRYMKQQGNRPQEGEHQMLLYGPFRNRMDMSKGASMENFEEGNHLIPQGMWRSKAHGTWAPDGKGPRLIDPEQEYKHGITFYIKGKFLATHGKESEENGTLIVGG